MIANINYSQYGLDVNRFNYESSKEYFLKSYKEFKVMNTDFDASFSSELGIDMIRLLVVEKTIDKNDLVFHYLHYTMHIDDDGIFDSYPEKFLGFESEHAGKIMLARWKNDDEDDMTRDRM